MYSAGPKGWLCYERDLLLLDACLESDPMLVPCNHCAGVVHGWDQPLLGNSVLSKTDRLSFIQWLRFPLPTIRAQAGKIRASFGEAFHMPPPVMMSSRVAWQPPSNFVIFASITFVRRLSPKYEQPPPIYMSVPLLPSWNRHPSSTSWNRR